MKRLVITRWFEPRAAKDVKEPTILDHGDPVIVERTKELLARRRLRALPDTHPTGL